jgi:hypothetical protein
LPRRGSPRHWKTTTLVAGLRLCRTIEAPHGHLKRAVEDALLLRGLRDFDLDRGGGFLAAVDGPMLIAFAVAWPELGNKLLKEYVELHAAYGYCEYRQGSLAALLPAVLNHPDEAWVRSWLPAIGAAVLAPNRGDFRYGFCFAVDAHRVRAGDQEALKRSVRHERRAC